MSEIDEYVIEGGKQTKHIGYLEKERDRMIDEQLDLTQKIEDIMDDMKFKKVLSLGLASTADFKPSF